MAHPASRLSDSFMFYSKNNRSFSGREIMSDNKMGMGSTWRLVWDALRQTYKEFPVMANTKPDNFNGTDVETWIDDHHK